jgi:hypothetical protein
MLDHLDKCKGKQAFEYDIPKTYIDYRQPADVIYEEHPEQKDQSYTKPEIPETAEFRAKSMRSLKDDDNREQLVSSYSMSARNKGKLY